MNRGALATSGKSLAGASLACALLLTALAGGGCSSGSGGDAVFGCGAVPACYTNALATLDACFPSSNLSLAGGTIASGVVSGLTCSGGLTSIAFSDFSSDPGSFVLVPGTSTIEYAGDPCATLGTLEGFHTMPGGGTVDFVGMRITGPGGAETSILLFDDGDIVIECPDFRQHTAPAGTLEGCPDAVLYPELVRVGTVTSLSVELIATDDSLEGELFVCD